MRRWPWVPCVIILGVGLALPVVARDPQVIQVTATEFNPATITVHKGDVVRWELQENAGSHVILSGNPDDEEPGRVFQFTLNGDKLEAEWVPSQTGSFPYYAAEAPQTMKGTITVTTATSVDASTWGRLKSLFERQ